MRHTALALALALLASLGGFVPGGGVQPAAASGPKVVIVVGSTHSVTSTYRTRADAAYAEAIKYTSNVVKVYSPNATWAAVKAAMQGASIVIYMGHGNGFPSPYRTTPWPYSQNGFGLNQTAGQGDDNNVYYGEHYIGSEVKLAPNAIVLLHHLCYASGNSEPGHAEPTVTVAKQRADNYAAGFLLAGARTVIAEGHMGPAYYLRALFTANQTVDQMWRASPSWKGNAFGFASVRSPGYTVQMDPDKATSGFYRAISGRMDLKTTEVIGAAAAPAPAQPASFTVPGKAAVATDGAGLFADAELTPDEATGLAQSTLALGTRVRTLATGLTSTGTPVMQVETETASAAGWMATGDLVPGDSEAPTVLELSTGAGTFSPNGDGRQDALTLTAKLSETAWWRVRYWQGATLWWSGSGEGSTVSATWAGLKDGVAVPDGTYRWTLETRDGWGNAGSLREGSVVVDTVPPKLGGLTIAAGAVVAFSPNGDGRGDTVALGWQTDEAGAVDFGVRDAAGSWVRTMSTTTAGGTGSTTWDGRSNAGSVVPDGSYTVRLIARDRAGNVTAPEYRQVTVYAALSKVVASAVRFYPQDGDRLATHTTFSFTLARPATVTWQIRKADGTPVFIRYDNAALVAGTYSFKWYGKDSTGANVPTGIYATHVRATNGTVGIAQATTVELNAFAIRSSNTTPKRGETVTVTATSAEPLTGNVYLHVTQPGLATWAVKMPKVATNTFRTAIKLRDSSAGTATFRVSALDVDGRWQASYMKFALQ
ncbi:MAG TPA: FlgD immunoglobulin-like domain containing protein [Vitreimonas sp.]|nr:FlgD immunoglobulin-like domain containing protein [Vitreimonas sp.]